MIRAPITYSPLLLAVLLACSLTTSLVTSVSAALAQGDEPWKMKGKLLGKPTDAGEPDGSKSEDVSAIACATAAGFPRICLLADDESQGAQIVILSDGKLIAGDFIRLIDDVHAGKPLELDAEGVAYADGSFYVIGSHGRPRHEADALGTLFEGRSEGAKLDRVGLGEDTLGKPRGIRDLVAFGNGWLLLAGPVSDPPANHDIKLGDYTVFSWNGSNAAKLLDLKGYGKAVKPEALLPLDEENGKLRALVFFDGPKEGAPQTVEIDLR
jgi:Protein of unknown function (DUF3616)